jgi:predicted alpha-1,2-mannosidase
VSPIDLVNPLCGTDSELSFSTGLIYPAVGVPGGMTYFAPRNRSGGQVFSRRRSWPVNEFGGFTATHAPSPWMGDFASFTIMPGYGRTAGPAAYRLADEHAAPERFAVKLTNGIDAALTATTRCGVMRFDFPNGVEPHVVLRLSCAQCTARQVGSHEVEGIAADGKDLVDGFAGRYVLRFNQPIVAAEPGNGTLTLRFAGHSGPLRVVAATSFIDHDQARLNADREVGDHDLEQVAAGTRAVWETELQRVQITGGTADQRRTFYTCLWRALLFPTTLTEPDADGTDRHRSPYTGRVELGHLVTNNGFWDTSRTVYPLLSLVYRRRYGRVVDGFLTAFRQSGWMPQWASPGHRSCMVGTHSAAVFADAINKGIDGFDERDAWASMLRDAIEPGDPEGRFGRQQLADYHRLGYCPEVPGQLDSVCRTLDYAHNDWCCAEVAQMLGETQHVETFRQRAGNWRNAFDVETKFFRPRTIEGGWAQPFEPVRWGGPYREGGPWQYRFAVPHDPAGLAAAMGGPDALAAALQEMVETPPSFRDGTYGREIHEMTELAAGPMGQYAHSNQPVHGALWTAAHAGRGDITDRLVRRVLSECYSPDAYAGDEDNGEMSAWFILASIGLFPHCPGAASYTTTAPLFDTVELHGDDGHVIRLGKDRPTRTVHHADLMHG